ncbi:heavy metal translocating P-type ATPase [Streptococcus cuniculipharyngis]|uniref:Cd(2+)-exporting ATPase n=1 Tax=Streptococcus cuniculipharyngis TaxID=1562651 RepID=A0A5C5SBA7_9STRE|nr:heavy metal translocating P-type ATPase [Streptococcus cuniculipharyngis]TWS98046.1 heavy metal translocating P-type ATPase [Streptococcus cuniculipharyngis]
MSKGKHNHQQKHNHSHNHSKVKLSPAVLFFVGIGIFILGLLLPVSDSVKAIFSTLAMLVSGYHVMWEGVEDTIKKTKEKGSFTPNTHILMTLAAIGAVLLGEATESALLIFIFAGAHFLEEYVEGRSQREITKLLQLNPTEARRLSADGSVEVVPVDQLAIGDRVQVLNGGQVPTDGVIVEGTTSIDESTINGESIPREKTVGDNVFGSTINGNGTFVMEVTKDSSDTVFSRILQLVEASQSNLSPTASRIRAFEPVYVNIVLLVFVILMFAGPLLFGWTLAKTFSIGLTFMVSASPCALAVSAVPATLAGISNLARQGVLFKGGAFLSNLSDLKAIAFDKTGTLTEGKPKVVDYQFETDVVTEAELKAILVGMEKQSNHPLATAIVNYFSAELTMEAPNLEVENRLGEGLVANYQGRTYRIAKPSSFDKISETWLQVKSDEESQGRTVVMVGLNDDVIGFIAIQDVPQTSAKTAIDYFNQAGVRTVMITGDAKLTGEAIGRQLGISEIAANVMPEQKADIIQKQQAKYGLTAMLGDGVNDAPALVTADIGVAMGDGTDVAIETADVVLMKNDLLKLVGAHKVSKRLKNVILQNIVFSMLVVFLLIGLTFFGNLSVVASVTLHEGSTLLVLLNSLRLLLNKK